MTEFEDIKQIAEACIALDSVIQEHGTDVMKSIVRMLLFEVGKELACLEVDQRTLPGAE